MPQTTAGLTAHDLDLLSTYVAQTRADYNRALDDGKDASFQCGVLLLLLSDCERILGDAS
ncbi:MAG: hypothetical protein ACRDMV_10830 [Streptosporangiales bacterium]